MKKIFFFVMIFVLVAFTVSADDHTITFDAGVVENPSPLIRVTYNESDSPIVIDESLLALYYDFGSARNIVLDENGNRVFSIDRFMVYDSFSPGLDAHDRFEFQVNKFLPDGDYVLVIEGNQYDNRSENNLGKEHSLEVSFSVEAESMRIWVSEPRIPFIQPATNQDAAVGNQDQFTLVLETQYATTCSIQREPTILRSPQEEFESGDTFNNVNPSPSTRHEILVVDQSYTQFQGDDTVLSVAGEFAYQTYDRNSNYLVVCRQVQANGQSLYHQKILYVGYDTTAPNITSEFIPDLIIDPNDMLTNLNISSQEDFMACNYRFTQQPPSSTSGKILSSSPVWLSDPSGGIADYTLDIFESFDMGNGLIDGTYSYELDRAYDFSAEIVCENLAGLETTQQANFVVQLDEDLEFTVVNEDGFALYGDNWHNYTSSNPEIHVQTNLLSTCEYIYDGVSTLISEEPTRDHIFTFSDVEDDIYGAEIRLRCQIPFSDTYYEDSIFIAKDSTPPSTPELSFEENEFTCDGSISVEIAFPDNDFTTFPYGDGGDQVRYEFALLEDGEILSTGQTEFFYGTNLVLNEQALDAPPSLSVNDFDKDYTWEVTAIDGVGQRSSTASFTIQRLDWNNPRCDAQAPTGSHDALLGPTGYEVSISCADPEGNCATSALYAQLPLGTSCEGIELQSISLSNTLNFDEDSVLCYQVFDLSQPDNKFSQVYQYDITPEVNIEFISPASGISAVKNFDLEFSTPSRNDRSLSCKHGPVSVAAENLFSQRDYQGLYELSFLEDVSDSNGREHTIPFNPSSTSVIGNQFDENLETDIQEWMIVCKEAGVEVYPVRFFDFGFDTTAPVLDFNVEPLVVENPLNMIANLNVVSDEDVFCEFRDLNNDPGVYTTLEPGIFEVFSTYEDTFNYQENYTDRDVFDVAAELRCYNKAGLFSLSSQNYRVEAKGDLEILFNLDEFYETQFLDLEARTPGQWSDCEISIDGDEYIEFSSRTGDQSLDYVHEHRVSLEDGSHSLQVKCSSWFNNEVGYVTQDIIIDTTDPTIDIQAKSPTCSVDTIKANIVTDGTGSSLVTQTYELRDSEENLITQGDLTDFVFELRNLQLTLGEEVSLEVYVEDQVGRNDTQTVEFLVATQENAACDVTPPESSLQVVDVYGGVELSVGCDDQQTTCTDSFYYYFDDAGSCLFDNPEQVQVARYSDNPILAIESSTFCYYVVDESLNEAVVESYDIDLILSCYNGLFDTTEEGVDCGGNCVLQDCNICRNNIFDEAWEDSTDCGGVCSAICSDGGFIPLSIELINPQHGVSDVRDFDFSIQTNRQAICRMGKYNPDLGLSNSDLFAQMRSLNYQQEFASNFNGQEHTLTIEGDVFAGASGLDAYLEPAIIICREFDDYVPLIIPYFGFDVTAPEVNILIEPNPVTDPSFLATQLTVSTDDLSVCKYTNRETGMADFFFGEDYFNRETYDTLRDVTLDYWGEDAFDDVQEISCTNLAGTTTEVTRTIEVRPEYSQDIQIFNDNQIYSQSSGRVLLEVNTSLRANCRYRLENDGDFIEMDMVDPVLGLQGNIPLATQHERQIFVDDGDYTVEVACNMLFDWTDSEQYAVASFTQDSTLPDVELTLFDVTCSVDSLQAGIAAADVTTDIVDIRYDIEVAGEMLRENTELSRPWNEFNTFIDLSPYQGSQVSLTIYVTDEAGNTRQVRRTSRVSSSVDPQCDFIAPIGTYELISVWNGYELQVTCEDNPGGSGCSSEYQFSFQDNGCADLFAPWPLRTPQVFSETGTLCAQVFDQRPNFGELFTQEIEVIENNCFNYQWDPDEESVDCGGVCDIACSAVEDLCENGVQDNFEEGVDCGGVCQDIRSCGCVGDDCLASCENGIADFNEDGVDCGGACSNACPIVVADADLALILPPFEVAATPDFVLEVRTQEQARCRHGFLANARPSDVDDWYLTLDSFDLSNGRTHTTEIRSSEISQLNENLASDSTSWVVICEADDEYYVREMYDFGFDTTPAQLSVSLLPDTLVDPGNMVSTLEILADERVACTYRVSGESSTFFPQSDVHVIDGYARDQSVELEYWGQDQVSEVYEVVCQNLAQTITRENVTLTVALTDDVGITSEMNDVYNTASVWLNFSTQQLATCRFRFDEDAAYDDFGVTQTYEHTKRISLDEGEHTIEVSCTSDSTGETALEFAEFYIDTIDPDIELISTPSTCGLDQYSFRVLADGTGSDIDEFAYELSVGGEELVSRRTSSSDITIDYDFEAGTSYRVSVIARDEAGNEREVSQTVRAEEFDPTSCDTIDPSGSISIEPRWNGYDVTVDCTDDIGCSDSFNYVLSSGVCEESYTPERYDNLPLAVTESTTFCYSVFDEAGNSFDGVEDIEYELACFNGVEDPGEEGIDCGGTCLAECGTCSNFVKDIFEEGLDCGGVCEHIRSCSDISGLYDEFIDSDLDGLNDPWEEFYFGDLDEDAAGDPDEDGLDNLGEFLSQTDPTKADTDEDGLDDFWEITYFGNQEEDASGDPDNDTLSNLIEYSIGTDPTRNDITDVDQDGLADQWEEFYFGNLEEDGEGDFDGDGYTNLEEYVFDTNPKIYTQREECSTDSDCNYGFRCDFSFTCVIDESLGNDIFDEVEAGVNIVGIILLVLGLLFMGAGIGYIIYSRKQFKKTSEKLSAQERAKQQKLLGEQRKKEAERKAAATAKKKAAQEKARKERLQQRKAKRSQVLKSFADKPAPKKENTKKQTPRKPSKLDDGMTEDFVDVRDLGKGSKSKEPVPKKLVQKSQENVFDSLSKISKRKKK